jgi:hypothetical protein
LREALDPSRILSHRREDKGRLSLRKVERSTMLMIRDMLVWRQELGKGWRASERQPDEGSMKRGGAAEAGGETDVPRSLDITEPRVASAVTAATRWAVASPVPLAEIST